MGETPDEPRGLYGQRPSRSHDGFRREEFARIARLTPIERMIEALELSEELEEVDTDVAESVASVLASLGIDSAVLGSMALASHKYIRNTDAFDLAICAAPLQLPAAKEALEKEEFDADLRLPDAEDPLGGVLRLTRRGIRRIEIVNYLNPFVQGAA